MFSQGSVEMSFELGYITDRGHIQYLNRSQIQNLYSFP